MARLLFIQDILFDYLGPMYLSSILKSKGHQCQLLVISEEKNLYLQIRKFSPHAILISSMTGPHKQYLEFIREMKGKISIPILMGGPHPTFFPEVLENSEIDFLCIGEGEQMITEFAQAITGKKSFKKIANLGYKKNGKTFYNPVRNLIEDLDSIPFPDRKLYYDQYPVLANFPTKRFLATRGCPYNCTFCFNHALKALYAGKGRYVRRRSAENIIQEILEVKEEYPLETVRFPDDSFTINKKWLLGLLSLYKKKVNLPFTCLVRANELDEKVVQALKEANCQNIYFGIESGNEKYRNEVLGKALLDKDIIKAAKLLRKYKILYGTYNMIGLPGETLDDAFETARFNYRIKSTLPTATILQPYPRTEIADYSKKHGYLDKDYNIDNFDVMTAGTVLNIEEKKELVNLNSFFFIAARFPILIPLIKILIKLPPNPLFKFFSFVSMGVVRLKAQNITPWEGIKTAKRFLGKI